MVVVSGKVAVEGRKFVPSERRSWPAGPEGGGSLGTLIRDRAGVAACEIGGRGGGRHRAIREGQGLAGGAGGLGDEEVGAVPLHRAGFRGCEVGAGGELQGREGGRAGLQVQQAGGTGGADPDVAAIGNRKTFPSS